VLLLLLRTGVRTGSRPPLLLGLYWAYTFPTAALANAALQYAGTNDAVVTTVLAVGLVALASVILVVVVGQTVWQQAAVCQGVEDWSDPIAARCQEQRLQQV